MQSAMTTTCPTQLFENERELRRFAVLPPEDRVLAAAAAGRAWCVEELFAQGCPIEAKNVNAWALVLSVNDAPRMSNLRIVRLPVRIPHPLTYSTVVVIRDLG